MLNVDDNDLNQVPLEDVVAMRFILRQPSPEWRSFRSAKTGIVIYCSMRFHDNNGFACFAYSAWKYHIWCPWTKAFSKYSIYVCPSRRKLIRTLLRGGGVICYSIMVSISSCEISAAVIRVYVGYKTFFRFQWTFAHSVATPVFFLKHLAPLVVSN